MSAMAALQIALIAAMKSDGGLAVATRGRIFDNPEVKGALPMITLGPSQELDDSAECIVAVECFQQIDVWTLEGGAQLFAKQICGLMRRTLHGADLALAEPYALSLIEVESVRILPDPEGKITHGVVSIRALIEEVS